MTAGRNDMIAAGAGAASIGCLKAGPVRPTERLPFEHDREKRVAVKTGIDAGFPEKSCANKKV